MPGEDQERFEDYLELELYIEKLQAGRVAHPPAELTPGQASIYRMAALFRSATPEANEPRPEFAAELQARLEQELQQPAKPERFSLLRRRKAGGANQGHNKRPGNVSRRALLTGGAAVAASLVAGAAIERTVEQARQPSGAANAPANYTGWIIGNDVPTTWHFVTTLAQLGEQAIRFTSDAVIGYVIRNDGDSQEADKGPVIAMSAACTHMGCIVQWQNADRKFHCPCHGGLFTEYGKVDAGTAPIRYLYALPRLNTKVENGNVYVEVPVSQK